MDRFDFTTTIDRTGSLSAKWNRDLITMFCNNPDAIPHWVADMEFPSPPAVRKALEEQAAHGVLGYPYHEEIASTFVQWSETRHGWNVDPSLVSQAPGMLASMALLIELYSEQGDSIVLPMPAYKPFVGIIRGLGRTIVPWPMVYDSDHHRFTLDLSALDALLSRPRCPILLFCSPHNPTGRVFTAEELEVVATILARHGTMVISDEIHADLTYEDIRHIPFDTVARSHGLRCATCMAPSKTFNIAGEHFSIVICSDSAMHSALTRRMRTLHVGPDLLATVTALAAYREGKTWLDDMRAHLGSLAQRIERLLETSDTPLRFVTPQASFIGLIDCEKIIDRVERDAVMNSELYDPKRSPEGGLLSRFFGQRAGIAMNDGSWFGKEYGAFVRFNYGTSGSAVDIAVNAIIGAVKRLR